MPSDKPLAEAHHGTLRGDTSKMPLTPASEDQQSRPGTIASRIRRMSKTFEESDLPEGFLAATGTIASSMISPSAPRKFSPNKHSRSSTSGQSHVVTNLGTGEKSLERMRSNVADNPTSPQDQLQPITDTSEDDSLVASEQLTTGPQDTGKDRCGLPTKSTGENDDGEMVARTRPRTNTEPFENGYHFPPSHGFAQSTKLGAVAFWRFFLTPTGFLVVLYGLLVVAWGGMLFLLLCNAAPAMCHPTCNHIDSPRRKWIEYDSQIVNALFCITGFGLAPWRIRDLYFLLQYRMWTKWEALQRLAGIHRGWFRLHGSERLGGNIGPDNVEIALQHEGIRPSIPYPPRQIPDAPLTGRRARPTMAWKMDFVIWSYFGNTVMQCLLSGFMWGMNRYNRPSWAVGLFVGLAMVMAAMGGIMVFLEGKKVKAIEGVPLSDADRRRLAQDQERNVSHYNNLKDRKPTPEQDK